MQKLRSITVLFFLVAVLFFSGCGLLTTDRKSGYYIIDVTGPAMVLNYSKSTFEFGSVSMYEGDTLSLVVSEGDLLYALFQGLESALLYRYAPDDGMDLSFSFDTVNDVCYLNDEIISLDLSEESGAWNWIEQHNAFQGIRSLNIFLPLPENGLESLGKIASVNPDPGLYVSGNGPMKELFNLFDPEWLFAEDIDPEIIQDATWGNLSKMELIVYACTDSGNLDFLLKLPGLQSLILTGCDGSTLAEFPFEKLAVLRSLCLIESDIHDLAFLGSLPGLENIDLVKCESLEKIGSLADFGNLNGLGFYDCHNLQDIPAINEIPDLERLCMPAGISQSDFSAILAAQPSLKVLELLNCENVTDLSPLKEYSGLEVLTISIDGADLSPLYGMQNLELLTLEQDYFKDSLHMDALKHALPDTRIVPGGTFCLGSGWLILLIPMIIIWVVLKKWKEAGS